MAEKVSEQASGFKVTLREVFPFLSCVCTERRFRREVNNYNAGIVSGVNKVDKIDVFAVDELRVGSQPQFGQHETKLTFLHSLTVAGGLVIPICWSNACQAARFLSSFENELLNCLTKAVRYRSQASSLLGLSLSHPACLRSRSNCALADSCLLYSNQVYCRKNASRGSMGYFPEKDLYDTVRR